LPTDCPRQFHTGFIYYFAVEVQLFFFLKFSASQYYGTTEQAALPQQKTKAKQLLLPLKPPVASAGSESS